MAVTASVIQPHPIRPPKAGVKTSLGRMLVYGLLAALLVWSYQGAEIAPAKLFSEAVEAIDPQPVEGIRATGANAVEEVIYGVIPQVMPLWVSYSLYRFESNIRSAAVVGMVGAGGIGVVLWEVIRAFQFAQTCAVMIMVVLLVSVVDVLSSRVRKLLI